MKTNIFEEKNINKAVLKIGLPAMLAQLATLIYNLADTYFVSLTHDSAQIAAVTLCTPVLLIIMSIACIFGIGGSSLISRLIGEGDTKKASRCLNFCTYAMIASGVIILVLGMLFANPIARIIGADESTFDFTVAYLRWIFIGAPAIMLANGFAHLFRSMGFVKEATVGIILGNVVNCILDWLFIVVFKWGTMGAAFATSLGFTCGTLYYLAILLINHIKKNELINISPKDFRVEKIMVLNVIKIGIPGALMTVLLSISNIVLNNFISIYGSESVAAYGIAYKIDMFPILLSVGLAQGTCPLLGFYYGKKDKDNLSKVMKAGSFYDVVLGAVLMVLILIGNRFFASLFSNDESLISTTSRFLVLLCWHAPIIGILNMFSSYFQALGKAGHTLAITLLRNVGLFIPGIIVMNALFQLTGVILNQFVVEVIMTVVSLILYLGARPGKLLKVEG